MNDFFVFLFLGLSVCSCIFHLLATLCALHFRFSRKANPSEKEWPKVSCLKPLYGADHELLNNLKTFLSQDYPDYEVILGSNTQEDKAYCIVSTFLENSEYKNARLIWGTKGQGTNRKVCNLRNIFDHVSPEAEILVLSDSDIKVTQEYLSQIIDPMRQDQNVGAVTCLYRVEKTHNLACFLEALSIETTFAPGVFVASTFAPLNCAFGATIAVRKEDFVKAGGFEKIENYLADDNKIGNLIHASGKKVVLSSYVVETLVSWHKTKDALLHLLRWNRTIRICQPTGYFFSVITHSTVWALASLCTLGFHAKGYFWFGAVCLLRIATASLISFSMGSFYGMLRAFFAPLWDAISTCLWFAGLLGRDVVWKKVRYTISPDGEMKEIKEAN